MELDLPAFPRMMFGKGNHAEVVHQTALGITLTFLNSHLPSGKHTKNYGKSPFSMGKSTISMVIFNSKLLT